MNQRRGQGDHPLNRQGGAAARCARFPVATSKSRQMAGRQVGGAARGGPEGAATTPSPGAQVGYFGYPLPFVLPFLLID